MPLMDKFGLNREDKSQEIEKLKGVAVTSSSADVKKKTIDALAAFGIPSINAINDIITSATSDDVKMYGLEAVRRIEEMKR